MAKKFRKFADAVERIDTEQLFLTAAKEQEQLALDLNRLQLVAEGIDGDGKSLGQYSPLTKKIKQAKGQDTDHITLLDTGQFQERMFLSTKEIPIFIDSKDSKTPILKNRFGDKILKLTKENQSEFGNEVRKIYSTKVNNTIEVLAKKILH